MHLDWPVFCHYSIFFLPIKIFHQIMSTVLVVLWLISNNIGTLYALFYCLRTVIPQMIYLSLLTSTTIIFISLCDSVSECCSNSFLCTKNICNKYILVIYLCDGSLWRSNTFILTLYISHFRDSRSSNREYSILEHLYETRVLCFTLTPVIPVNASGAGLRCGLQ